MLCLDMASYSLIFRPETLTMINSLKYDFLGLLTPLLPAGAYLVPRHAHGTPPRHPPKTPTQKKTQIMKNT